MHFSNSVSCYLGAYDEEKGREKMAAAVTCAFWDGGNISPGGYFNFPLAHCTDVCLVWSERKKPVNQKCFHHEKRDPNLKKFRGPMTKEVETVLLNQVHSGSPSEGKA